jgi:hypothetical protein
MSPVYVRCLNVYVDHCLKQLGGRSLLLLLALQCSVLCVWHLLQASPYLAGVVALWRQRQRQLKITRPAGSWAAAAAQALKNTARPIRYSNSTLMWPPLRTGAGLVKVGVAMLQATRMGCSLSDLLFFCWNALSATQLGQLDLTSCASLCHCCVPCRHRACRAQLRLCTAYMCPNSTVFQKGTHSLLMPSA